MANPRVWDPPLVFNAPPGSAALNALDVLVSQCINGVTGGAESPVAPIIIGGAGLQVTSTLTIPSAGALVLAAGSTLTVGGTSTFNAASTFNSTLTVNGAATFNANIALAVGTTVTHPARTYTRGPSGIYMVEVSPTQWVVPSGATPPIGGAYEQGSDVTTGSAVLWRMAVPCNSIVTGISMWVDPPSGHGGVLPTTRPMFTGYVVNSTLGTFGTIAGSATSDPTLIASYEAPHQFSSGVLAGSVGSDEFVVIAVRGEYGGSAQPGLLAYPPAVTFTRTKLGEE